ncbi:MAG: patatin-like phospholipase family protein, partial [Saprospiraceae bacterium]|nr:patatin-like phospholipase family protein [Saprospiraceae bacterium]
MSKLMFLAGDEAYIRIKEQGLSAHDIYGVVAAAGGPKWFTTYGLMRSIIADFLESVTHPIHFMGSSVGAWQVTAALTNDPGAALD